jgi:hypothetical protein
LKFGVLEVISAKVLKLNKLSFLKVTEAFKDDPVMSPAIIEDAFTSK